jgi:anaphase-promoting complex subunit 4
MDEDDRKLPSSGPVSQLTFVAEKNLPARCEPGTLAYCPTMDIVALIAEDKQLHVFRLNGQRVFGGSFAGDLFTDSDEQGEVQVIRWRSDGRGLFFSMMMIPDFYQVLHLMA